MKFESSTYRHFRESFSDVQEPENFAPIATVLWRVLLALLLACALLSAVYGTFLIQEVLALPDSSDTATQKSLTSNSNRKDLDAIVAAFAARKNTYDQLKAQPLSVPDPAQ